MGPLDVPVNESLPPSDFMDENGGAVMDMSRAQVGLAIVERERAQTEHFPEDVALARRAVARDEEAWRVIYERTRERLFALLMYHTGRREEALELLQETYLCALRTIHRYSGTGALEGWFAIIAIRRANDWKRKLVRWRRRDAAFQGARQTEAPPEIDADRRRELQGALEQLGGRQRAVFLLRMFAELSFREIGAAVGCNEATARVHFHRARAAMQNLLSSDPSRRDAAKKPKVRPKRGCESSGDAEGIPGCDAESEEV